ncbi:hypothetical protein AbraCBS73388_002544 [Aspergillus brasiliensis]|uniref:Uncharacterized protein n=1 Tax=Aspergillus brasiliensis TaxID=319629 RepID=A0A9W5YZA4_9EURO|nr:hypothetical protein AbraCBS73388_002544 [Aspergillus brasiliensis]
MSSNLYPQDYAKFGPPQEVQDGQILGFNALEIPQGNGLRHDLRSILASKNRWIDNREYVNKRSGNSRGEPGQILRWTVWCLAWNKRQVERYRDQEDTAAVDDRSGLYTRKIQEDQLRGNQEKAQTGDKIRRRPRKERGPDAYP